MGYDQRERVGFHVFEGSALARTRATVTFTPVRSDKVVGSTQFNAQRFAVPAMCGYKGWAIWAECDMLVRADIEELWALQNSDFDVLVCQHDYKTKHPVKFLGQPNPDYPRKNWSSLMLINCAAAVWPRIDELKPTLGELHRFSPKFFSPDRVGSLPLAWNHLVGEYDPNPEAKIVHFTIGLPCWQPYDGWEFAREWRLERDALLEHA